MAKLISETSAHQFYEQSQEWLVDDRFVLTVYHGKEYCSIFMYDKTDYFQSLELIPKMLEALKLLDNDQNIELSPSIDTCSIVVPLKKYEQIFKFIENYPTKLSS